VLTLADKPKKISVADLGKSKFEKIKIDDVAKEKIDPPVNIEGVREITARNLSIIMVCIFILTISVPIFIEGTIDYIKYILPSITTLLGVSFGFYFSAKRLG